MIAKIFPSSAHGTVNAPPSKSMAHRLLICAAMSDGVSTVRGISNCDDVSATVDCLTSLGAIIKADGDIYTVTGADMHTAAPGRVLMCHESGSTLRFIIPLAMISGNTVRLRGASSLMSRPMSVYEELFSEREASFCKNGDTVTVSGPLSAGEYIVRGDVSSQFITGLLFALPLLDGDSVIKILPPFESKSYIDLTLIALHKFGIDVSFSDELTICIKGNQRYKPCSVTVEGDYSGSAFTDALGIFSNGVQVLGLDENSFQGDRVYKDFYKELQAGTPTLNIENCPDLGPVLFALAAALNGAEFLGTARLKIKESDRAAVMAEELKKLGAKIEIFENSVTVKKSSLHAPSKPIYGHNDHRVVMSMAVLLSLFGGEIHGADAVKKSYPAFFDDIKKLGIKVELYD